MPQKLEATLEAKRRLEKRATASRFFPKRTHLLPGGPAARRNYFPRTSAGEQGLMKKGARALRQRERIAPLDAKAGKAGKAGRPVVVNLAPNLTTRFV